MRALHAGHFSYSANTNVRQIPSKPRPNQSERVPDRLIGSLRGHPESEFGKSFQTAKPIAKMGALPAHPLNTNRLRRQSSLDDFPVSRIRSRHSLRRCTLGVIVDVFRCRKAVAHLLEAAREQWLAKRAREGIWIAKQQTLEFVQGEIGNQSNVWPVIWYLTTNTVFHRALYVFDLLNVPESFGSRHSGEAPTESIVVEHRRTIRPSVLLELPQNIFLHARVVGSPAFVSRDTEDYWRNVYLSEQEGFGQWSTDEGFFRRPFHDHANAAHWGDSPPGIDSSRRSSRGLPPRRFFCQSSPSVYSSSHSES